MAQAPLTDTRRVAHLVARLLSPNASAAADALAPLLGLTPQTIRGRLTNFDPGAAVADLRRLCAEPQAPEATVAEVAAAQRAQDAARRAEAQATALAREVAGLTEIRETIFGLARTPAEPTPITPLARSRRRLTAFLNLTDTHLGKRFDRSAVHGLQDFNSEIAERRLRRSFALATGLIREKDVGLDRLVVMLGGDNCNGELRDDDLRSNDLNPMQQAVRVAAAVNDGIGHMREAFPEVPVTVLGHLGNHGRTVKAPPSTDLMVNWDYLAALLVERHWQRDPMVEVIAAETPDIVLPVYDYAVHTSHGDRIGAYGGNGIIGSMGPTKRGAMRIAAQVDAIRDYMPAVPRLALTVFGHWHSFWTDFKAFSCGCLCGPDPWSLYTLRVAPAPAMAHLLFLHHERRLVDFRPIWPGLPDEGPLYGADSDDAVRRAMSALAA